MPRPSTGYGANWGYNFGGGGIVYLADVVPAPGATIPGSEISFKVGVQGSLIDISKVVVKVNSETAFDGSVPGFLGPYLSSSSYGYSAEHNGYEFTVRRDGGYVDATVQVSVEAETFDGGTTVQTYALQAFASFAYPPVPLGVELGRIPLSSFTGEATNPPLGDAAGLLFVAAPLTARLQSPDGSVDFDRVELATQAFDAYEMRESDDTRPWLWGPPLPPAVDPPAFPPEYSADYEPVFNDARYGLMKTGGGDCVGVLTDTTTLQSTVILY